MASERVNILGVKIDKTSMGEAVKLCMEMLERGGVVFTPNSEIVMQAYRDPEFAEILNSADLLVPDGIGIVYASRMLRNRIQARVAGFDLVTNLLSKLNGTGHGVFILGGKPGVAEAARENLKKRFENLNIVGVHDGYFTDDEKVIKEINEKKPSLLLVCLGAPKQEKWIYKNRERLDAKLMIGAGGTVDVYAGTSKRAPDIFINLNLEWFYRLCTQPWRIARMADLPRFALTVLLKGGRYK